MSGKNWLSVRVSRIAEGMHDPPYETIAANGVVVEPDGSLSIRSTSGSRSLSAGLWDGFEVKRTSMPD